MAYNLRPVPTKPEKLTSWLGEELRRIELAFKTVDRVQLQELNEAPDRPQTGQIELADGTNWNPGSGQGVYIYYGGAWNKLG